MEILCAAKHDNILGEGPLWDAGRGRMCWVDIRTSTIHWLELHNERSGSYRVGHRVSAMALRKGGGLLLATDHGFASFDADTAEVELIEHPEPDRPTNRSNDGHTDAKGRFWLGTMDDRQQTRSGALYRLDPDWRCTRVLDGLGIPNTVLCTSDCRQLYLADSSEQELYRFDVDSEGTVGERRIFASTKSGPGTPDGSALDADGFLWNAQWGGWRVVRYAPDGSIDRIVKMPVEQPTSCAFGGDDLSTLYVTSARDGLSDDALAHQPLAGSLFAFKPGVKGVPLAPFGG